MEPQTEMNFIILDSTLRYSQVNSGTLRYTQGTFKVHSDSQVHSRYTQIFSGTLKVHSDNLRYTQILR